MEQVKRIKRQETKKRVNLRLEPSLVAALRAEAARQGVSHPTAKAVGFPARIL